MKEMKVRTKTITITYSTTDVSEKKYSKSNLFGEK